MQKQPRTVRIENTGGYATRNRAGRFIKQGKAEWTDESQAVIRFVAHFENTAPAQWNAQLAVIAAPSWQPSYRNTAAPVLQPSIEWLRSRRQGVRG